MAGEIGDVGVLYEKHKVALVAHFFRRGLRLQDAEDAVQKVFERLLERRPESPVIRDLEAWLFGTASNVAADIFWERARMTADAPPAEAPDQPDRSAETKEFCAALAEAVRELPEELRMLLLLRYWKDWSYRRIGERLGITSNAARLRLFRARELLRQRLGPRG